MNRTNKYNLYVKTMSNSNNISTIHLLIDNKKLPESNVLLSKQYITPNYIDNELFPTLKTFIFMGK